jgi:hypothetical protein
MDAPSQNEELRGGVPRYAAQATPEFDAEIAEKGHLWMETTYVLTVLRGQDNLKN